MRGPGDFEHILAVFREMWAQEPDGGEELAALMPNLAGLAGALMDAEDLSRRSAKKRRGRPKGSLGRAATAVRTEVWRLTELYVRMTVRQVFYQLEMAGVVAKTEGGYRQVQRQVLLMRREGLLAWEFIVDGTRWQRKPTTWDGLEDYVTYMARSYRRNLWQGRGVRIEVWLEKDALADIIVDITHKWDVALMVSRGQSSATFIHNAAKAAEQAYNADGTVTYIYALYDHDAGGARASSTIERELPTYAPGVPIYFERLAVTEDQITEWSLPTRPPKAKDPEAKTWGDRPCVELDAINPRTLTALVEEAIERHVDPQAFAVEQAVEAEERRGLLTLLDGEAA
jgi:hypothetical protein